MIPHKRGGGGGSGAQKCAPVPLPDAVGAKKKISTPTDQSGSVWVRPRVSPSEGHVKPQVDQKTAPMLSRRTLRMMDKTLESTMKV